MSLSELDLADYSTFGTTIPDIRVTAPDMVVNEEGQVPESSDDEKDSIDLEVIEEGLNMINESSACEESEIDETPQDPMDKVPVILQGKAALKDAKSERAKIRLQRLQMNEQAKARQLSSPIGKVI
jgi:hypothetical protein